MEQKAFIAGCKSTTLTQEEVDFFKDQKPWGFIIFARNIENREQVRALCSSMRECVGREDAPILIDEEGGRVQRLRPPNWISNPPGRALGKLYEQDAQMGKKAAWALSRLIAHDLCEIGVNVDCLPVLDIPVEGAHDVIGDRAYSSDPDTVAVLGECAANGLLAGGVLPIIKHIPGHGRSTCDSHHDLPRVDCDLETLKQVDFKPFKALNTMPMAMTAHIVYSAIDEECATRSSKVIEEIIRGYIGFDGLLMSDDVSMKALSGDYAQRTKSCFDAGCDIVLHCNGLMEEMKAVANATLKLDSTALERAQNALSLLKKPDSEDLALLRKDFDARIASLTA